MMKMRGSTAVGIGLVSIVMLLAIFTALTTDAAPMVPDTLKVPAGQNLALEAHAVGVQIYDCKASKDDPTRFEWTFRAPEALLFDATGKKIGKHYAGPTWESDDGSMAVGAVKAQDSGPDANAIPWLLLGVKSTSGGGVLGHTVSVQRLATVGGKAPVDGCSEAQPVKEARVPYTATYDFYVAAPRAANSYY